MRPRAVCMDLRMEVSPRPKGDKTSLKRSKWWTRLRSLINADAAVARYGANDRAWLLVDHLPAELAHRGGKRQPTTTKSSELSAASCWPRPAQRFHRERVTSRDDCEQRNARPPRLSVETSACGPHERSPVNSRRHYLPFGLSFGGFCFSSSRAAFFRVF